METSTGHGLTVTFDSETSTFSFEWDPDLNPEYDFLKSYTDEDFSNMIKDRLTQLENEETGTEIPTGGSSCGTPESVLHSEPQL